MKKRRAETAPSAVPAGETGKSDEQSKRLEILTRLRDSNPHPTTELNFTSPFELLIAVLLSAQATDVSVNKATANLPGRQYTSRDAGTGRRRREILYQNHRFI